MNRLERLRDLFDDHSCLQCGECCMVIVLNSISRDEAERLGIEFCYPVTDRPGRWGIKRVYRDWQPEWASEGVCVFLYPDEEHDGRYLCKARPERPSMCLDFKCVSRHWAPIMDKQVAEYKLNDDWPLLSCGERKLRELQYDEIDAEYQRALKKSCELRARRARQSGYVPVRIVQRETVDEN